jgi:hypothetical protein
MKERVYLAPGGGHLIGAAVPTRGQTSSVVPDRLWAITTREVYTPVSRGFQEMGELVLSSISFNRRTRCRAAKAILWSCSWIRSQKPSDVFRCRADHVSMFCSRSCVRLQRGSVVSLGSSAECEPLKPLIQPLQADGRSRGAIGGQRGSCKSRAIFGLVCIAAMPEHVGAGLVNR